MSRLHRAIGIAIIACALLFYLADSGSAQKEIWTNNGASTLASGITNSATSLTVQAGHGARFPSITGSNYFYVTLEDNPVTKREIVKVTARSTDTFTIVRAQQNTTASAFSAGDKVEQRLTADTLNVLQSRAPVLLRVAANVSNSTTTFSDVTGLTTSVVAGTYYFDCQLQAFGSATTVAPQFSVNGPSASEINYQVTQATSATAIFSGVQTAYDTVTNAATGVATPGGPATMVGSIIFTASGTFAIRMRSEVASSAVTMVRGSYCRVFQ